MIGDFNDLDTSQFVRHINVAQMVKTNTRDNLILDMVFTDSPQDYREAVIKAPIANSDQACVFVPASGRQSSSLIIKRYSLPLRDSNMRSFSQWITTFNFDWLRELESPDNMVDVRSTGCAVPGLSN